MASVVLKPGKDRKIRGFYPWVYADEVEAVKGEPSPGDIVQVEDTRGQTIGRAFFNPHCHIPLRMITLDPDQAVDRSFLEGKLRDAARRRESRIQNTNAIRLVHAEADGLPGLIVDRFADTLVMQLRNPGIERLELEIIRSLKHLFSPSGIFERSDVQAREEEGMEPRSGPVFGRIPENIEIFEDDVHLQVDVQSGQKTGFYADQRDNRRLLRSMVGQGSRVLDVYSYTGAFSLHAARAGAQALAVDKDDNALRVLEANARLNGLSEKVGARWGDALKVLADLNAEGRTFTHVVLDPPTLAKHKDDVSRVKQMFAEITGLALQVLQPQGCLFLSTCAYHISTDDLIESARRAANQMGRPCQVLAVTFQPPDHPWILQIPETLYLKTLVLRLD